MKFVQAKHFTNVAKRDIRLQVIHCMQIPEKPTTAEGCAEYFRRGERRASAHYCFDSNSVVQCVEDMDVAYAAPGANHDGLHHELAGYAEQSEAEWLDPYSLNTMNLCAAVVAEKCKFYDNDPVFLNAGDLLNSKNRGITTHWEVTKAFKKSTHTDPGRFFPVDHFIRVVQNYLNSGDMVEMNLDAKAVPGAGYWPNGRKPFGFLTYDGHFLLQNNLPGNPSGWYRGDYHREKDGTLRPTQIPHAPIVGWDWILDPVNRPAGYEVYCEDGGVNTFK